MIYEVRRSQTSYIYLVKFAEWPPRALKRETLNECSCAATKKSTKIMTFFKYYGIIFISLDKALKYSDGNWHHPTVGAPPVFADITYSERKV